MIYRKIKIFLQGKKSKSKISSTKTFTFRTQIDNLWYQGYNPESSPVRSPECKKQEQTSIPDW